MSHKRPIHVEVIAKPGESGEALIRRFMKKVKKEEIFEQVRANEYFEKPSTKRRREAKERKRILELLEMGVDVDKIKRHRS